MCEFKPIEEHWYAFRVLHNRISEAKNLFQNANYPTYIPMKVVESTDIYYNVTSVTIPLIPSLIFARTPMDFAIRSRRDAYAPITPYCNLGTVEPAVISDAEMRNFMFVTQVGADKLKEYPIHLVQGDRVRIIGGVFKGAEGIIKRVSHNMRFIVTVQGTAVMVNSYIPKKFIEKL